MKLNEILSWEDLRNHLHFIIDKGFMLVYSPIIGAVSNYASSIGMGTFPDTVFFPVPRKLGREVFFHNSFYYTERTCKKIIEDEDFFENVIAIKIMRSPHTYLYSIKKIDHSKKEESINTIIDEIFTYSESLEQNVQYHLKTFHIASIPECESCGFGTYQIGIPNGKEIIYKCIKCQTFPESLEMECINYVRGRSPYILYEGEKIILDGRRVLQGMRDEVIQMIDTKWKENVISKEKIISIDVSTFTINENKIAEVQKTVREYFSHYKIHGRDFLFKDSDTFSFSTYIRESTLESYKLSYGRNFSLYYELQSYINEPLPVELSFLENVDGLHNICKFIESKLNNDFFKIHHYESKFNIYTVFFFTILIKKKNLISVMEYFEHFADIKITQDFLSFKTRRDLISWTKKEIYEKISTFVQSNEYENLVDDDILHFFLFPMISIDENTHSYSVKWWTWEYIKKYIDPDYDASDFFEKRSLKENFDEEKWKGVVEYATNKTLDIFSEDEDMRKGIGNKGKMVAYVGNVFFSTFSIPRWRIEKIE